MYIYKLCEIYEYIGLYTYTTGENQDAACYIKSHTIDDHIIFDAKWNLSAIKWNYCVQVIRSL